MLAVSKILILNKKRRIFFSKNANFGLSSDCFQIKNQQIFFHFTNINKDQLFSRSNLVETFQVLFPKIPLL